MKYTSFFAIILSGIFGGLLSGTAGDKSSHVRSRPPQALRVDQVFQKINELKDKKVAIIGYLGTASNQNEHFILPQTHDGVVFNHSVLSLQLRTGLAVDQLDSFLQSGFNNIFINELVLAEGTIRKAENENVMYLTDVGKISFPMLEEKMRAAEIYGFTSKPK
jgi:hypothetical protein